MEEQNEGKVSTKKASDPSFLPTGLEITDKMLEDDFEDVFRNYPLNEDTTCGFGSCRGSFLQKFANKKMFIILFGIAGSIFSGTFAYFNGTITTMEKRFKISSTNSAIITTGNNVSSLIVASYLSYYAGKGHRPRWIGFGLFTITMFCVFSVIPHFLYGPGEQALRLTKEYGGMANDTATIEILEKEQRKFMCNVESSTGNEDCDEQTDYWIPMVFLFLGQLSIGIGQCVYNSIGVAYMDDNIKKTKTPALISASYFLRLLGPAGGYALASYCLQLYIVPNLTPTITNKDPRWLGAWWIGWIVLAFIMTIFSIILSLFPKELPRSYLRRRIDVEKRKRGIITLESNELRDDNQKPSLRDFYVTFKRLLKNKTYMVNNVSSVFYFFGFEIYVIFMPKYIETQYKQSASTASFYTGAVGMVFSAIGILSAGLVITKFKPRARSLALWNVIVGFLAVLGILVYTQLGCAENENSVVLNAPLPDILDPTCNSNCNCDYVKYSPVCGADNKIYISPCHAGCKSYHKDNGTKFFIDCSCIDNTFGYDFEKFSLPINMTEVPDETFIESFEKAKNYIFNGSAEDKTCPINCQNEFVLFLMVTCFLKFAEATGRASNFLVGMRCIEERDKSLALGFSFAFFALFSFLPSPVFYGALIDMGCILWGKTCTGTGNCWLYDTEWLRYWLNSIACIFVFLGVVFDIGVWYLVKDLKIFDGESESVEMQKTNEHQND